MEPSCPLGTTRCVLQAKFPQKPYNKSFIDQVCSVKMAGYWPRSFLVFMNLDFVLVHKHAKKELGQYPAILTSHLVNNPYVFINLADLCPVHTTLEEFENGGFTLKMHKAFSVRTSYFSSRHEAHKAVTVSRQLALSCAAPLTSDQLDHLFCLDSFSTVLLHVVLGRPTFLFPSGFHSIATMQSSFLSFLSTWPIQFHLLLRISSLIFVTPVIWEIVSFLMRCGHQILKIRLRHVN